MMMMINRNSVGNSTGSCHDNNDYHVNTSSCCNSQDNKEIRSLSNLQITFLKRQSFPIYLVLLLSLVVLQSICNVHAFTPLSTTTFPFHQKQHQKQQQQQLQQLQMKYDNNNHHQIQRVMLKKRKTMTKQNKLPLYVTASSDNDPIMRELVFKEAKIQKEREKTAAKLLEMDTSLQKLQSYKQEYIANIDTKVDGSYTESTLRSAVKSFVWRIIAGSITFITTYQYSGSLKQALQVVSGDFLTKSFTMFLGERIMNKSQLGRSVKTGGDNVSRSIIKAIIWRLFAVSNTLCMAIFISKDWTVAYKIASTDALFKTFLMFIYERVWTKQIQWGKEYFIEFSI